MSGRTQSTDALATTSHAGFRADIQGMRAIAVLVVILFHAGTAGFGGGYIGVDVFFVVSGFLICGLLQRELAATGGIDLGRFWARRIKRLMPNAVLVLLATLAAVLLVQPLFTHKEAAQAVTAAAFYVANLHFAARDVDYFVDATPSPVLHFWSLSVEEQFYIVWPLALFVLAWAVPRRLRTVAGFWLLALVAAVSFVAALIVAGSSPTTAFYHAELRAWQFAAGGLLAVTEAIWSARFVRLRGLLAAAGLIAIAAATLLYTETMHYPGAWALVPTLATAALLAAPAGPVRTLLSHGALGWIGDRSYSLYLWHWPALVLVARAFPEGFGPGLLPIPTPYVALALGVALALIAYSTVEVPMRQAKLPALPRLLPIAGGAAGLAAVLGACWLATQPRLLFDKPTRALANTIAADTRDRGRNIKAKCNRTFNQTDQPLCAYGDPDGTRTVVLFGDSHAAQWFEAVDAAAKQNGWRLLAWTKSACPPADVSTWHRKMRAPFAACEQWREGVLARMTGAEKPDLVLVSGYVDSVVLTLDDDGKAMPLKPAKKRWTGGLVRTFDRLSAAGVPVTLIADTPRARRRFTDCLASGGGSACDHPRAQALPTSRVDHEAAARAGVPVLDLTEHICGPESCPAMANGRLVFRDEHHLTASFAASLASAFLPLLPPPGHPAQALRGHQLPEDEAAEAAEPGLAAR